jgi:hypothetical protein
MKNLDLKELRESSLKAKILSDFSASYWLKGAIQDLDQRDPVDALHDALALVNVCKERLEQIQ